MEEPYAQSSSVNDGAERQPVDEQLDGSAVSSTLECDHERSTSAEKGTQTMPTTDYEDVCLRCAARLHRCTSEAACQTEPEFAGSAKETTSTLDDCGQEPMQASTPVPRLSASLFSRHLSAPPSPILDSPVDDTIDVSSAVEEEDKDESYEMPSADSDSCASEDLPGDTRIHDDDDLWGLDVGASGERKYVVFESKLSSLFTRCQECGSAIIHKSRTEVGSMLRVTTECAQQHVRTWESQPSVRNKLPAGNYYTLQWQAFLFVVQRFILSTRHVGNYSIVQLN